MDTTSQFTTNILAAYGDVGKNWLKELPTHLKLLSQLWDFRFIKAIPDLTYSFVALVELNSTHEIVILKTAPDKGIIHEAHWLQSFKKGVPLIFNVDEQHNAILMEFLQPGIRLSSLVTQKKDEQATKIISQAVLELQSQQPELLSSCKHLSELSQSLPILKGKVEDSLLSKAESLFHDLTLDRTHDVLLHGDLHHDNLLKSNTSWKVIDPHGYIGEPTAEIGAMIYNPLGFFSSHQPLKKIIKTRLQILSEMLPFDPYRIRAWAYCWTILSAAWDFEGYGRIDGNKIEIALAIDAV